MTLSLDCNILFLLVTSEIHEIITLQVKNTPNIKKTNKQQQKKKTVECGFFDNAFFYFFFKLMKFSMREHLCKR